MAQTITVTNTGNRVVELREPTSADSSFIIGKLTKTKLASDGSGTATFTVRPKADLAVGEHKGTITIYGMSEPNDVSEKLNVSFTVIPESEAPVIEVTSTGLDRLKVGLKVSNARIDYTLRNAKYVPDINTDFNVDNKLLPTGLTALNATRTNDNDTVVTVFITGTPTEVSTSTKIIKTPPTVAPGNIRGASSPIKVMGVVQISAVTIGDGAVVSTPTVSGTPSETEITVEAVSPPATGQTVQYTITTSTSELPTSDWGEKTTFSNLNAGTTYYVWARSAANKNYDAGKAQHSDSIRTKHIYKISATPNLLFGVQETRYKPEEKIVTITNNSTVEERLINPTSTYNYFEFGPYNISGSTATFTVRPTEGLKEGTYNDTITVSSMNGTSAKISVSFTVVNKPIYPPSAPVAFKVMPRFEKVILKWDKPDYDGESHITSYMISYGTTADYQENKDTIKVSSTEKTYTIPKLTNGTKYSFNVFAVNAAGDSKSSRVRTTKPKENIYFAITGGGSDYGTYSLGELNTDKYFYGGGFTFGADVAYFLSANWGVGGKYNKSFYNVRSSGSVQFSYKDKVSFVGPAVFYKWWMKGESEDVWITLSAGIGNLKWDLTNIREYNVSKVNETYTTVGGIWSISFGGLVSKHVGATVLNLQGVLGSFKDQYGWKRYPATIGFTLGVNFSF